MSESSLKSTNLVQSVSQEFPWFFIVCFAGLSSTLRSLLQFIHFYIYKGGSANVYVMIASEAEIWDSWCDNENT